jgi:hypothetical protein
MTYDEIIEGWPSPAGDGARLVIGWTSYKDVASRGLKEVGWNGFEKIEFNDQSDETPYFEAFREAVIARDLKRGGDWHQGDETGVAVFDDGAVAVFSFRAWGTAMASIWSGPDGVEYSYLNFYMDSYVRDYVCDLKPPRDEWW